MTTPLLVCKRLEQRGKIAGLYLHEAMLLLLGCTLVFLLVLALRKAFQLHMLWLLTAPALFIIAFLVAKTTRKRPQPHFLMAYLTFHWLAPRHLTLTRPHYVSKKR